MQCGTLIEIFHGEAGSVAQRFVELIKFDPFNKDIARPNGRKIFELKSLVIHPIDGVAISLSPQQNVKDSGPTIKGALLPQRSQSSVGLSICV